MTGRKIRCAIYTRKSSDDGLEQEFNSLHAQREACEAYILSQKHEGWVCLPDQFDDGGISGGTMERPGLKRLLDGIKAGKIDQVVVYKIDRLTRSLSDFSKIVDILDEAAATFVSVTQSFNTATSMGRLTLNMLLSFAQFEREVTSERIRDKIAASKRKGMWMGGFVPLGYRSEGRTLVIHEEKAKIVRLIYDTYRAEGRINAVKELLDRRKIRTSIRTFTSGITRGGKPFSFGHVHHILTNPVYAGRIRHNTAVYDGQHPPIIDPLDWDAIQDRLVDNANNERRGRDRARGRRRTKGSPLAGKLFDEIGDFLSPSNARSRTGARLRYYISHRLVRGTREEHPDAWRLPADELERKLFAALTDHLAKPAVRAGLIVGADGAEITQLGKRLDDLGRCAGDAVREGLSVIQRVTISPGQLEVKLDKERLAGLLELPIDQLNEACLRFEAPFQLRRRGVETKLILGGEQRQRDETLFRNIAKGRQVLDLVCAGKSYSRIADELGTSKRNVQHLIEFAFLAPDIIEDVYDGKQPIGFTSEWVKRNKLPSDWDAQRAMVARL
ncbi:MAG: recombinase family protein [Shimia sp.]